MGYRSSSVMQWKEKGEIERLAMLAKVMLDLIGSIGELERESDALGNYTKDLMILLPQYPQLSSCYKPKHINRIQLNKTIYSLIKDL